MKSLSEYQEYLMYAKVTDSLSTEEEGDFVQLMHDNPDAEVAFNELINKFPEEDVMNSFSRFKHPAKWKDIGNIFRQEARIKRISFMKSIAAAAILTAVVTGGWLFWKNDRNVPANRPARDLAASPSKTGIQLKLAGGKTIDLSVSKGSIQTNTLQLTNEDKTLKYSVKDNAPSGMNSLIVPVGMDYKINLADGSEVWLNAATQLDFPLAFSGNTREIRINGEAYLRIAKDARKPFIVHLPESSVSVLGTEFNVNTYDSGIVKVALVKGAVNMEAAEGRSSLSPGKEAIYHLGKSIEQQTFNAKTELGWREGLFYFQNASLAEISRVLPRWYGIKVIIDQPSLVTRKFTGLLDKKQSVSVFVDNLKAISKIDAYFTREGVLHFK